MALLILSTTTRPFKDIHDLNMPQNGTEFDNPALKHSAHNCIV